MTVITEYTGFVYLWFDSYNRMFYLGSHHGSLNDGYIGSNKWFQRAYKKRPNTFRRRILEYHTGSIKELHQKEQKWLNLIKDHHLSTSETVLSGSRRYYNMKKYASGGNGSANKGNSNIGGHNAFSWIVDGPNGTFRTNSLYKFCSEHNLSKDTLYKSYITGKRPTRGRCSGWILTKEKED